MIEGAIRRHMLFEDVIGHLRVDVLRAAGVVMSDTPGPSKLKPGEKHPTFELVMGRKPIDILNRTPRRAESSMPEPMSPEKFDRGMAMIRASHARRDAKRKAESESRPE